MMVSGFALRHLQDAVYGEQPLQWANPHMRTITLRFRNIQCQLQLQSGPLSSVVI